MYHYTFILNVGHILLNESPIIRGFRSIYILHARDEMSIRMLNYIIAL